MSSKVDVKIDWVYICVHPLFLNSLKKKHDSKVEARVMLTARQIFIELRLTPDF